LAGANNQYPISNKGGRPKTEVGRFEDTELRAFESATAETSKAMQQ